MRMFKAFFASVIAFLSVANVLSAQSFQVRYDDEDPAIFYERITHAKHSSAQTMGDLVVDIALNMLGTPYVAATLEQEPEMLTINMRETDCILFVEMCVALAITSKEEHPSFDQYCENVRNFRYRGGVVDGYVSRIHYTSEWINQNSARGLMREFTAESGDTLNQKFSYMSTHSESYKQLKSSPEMVQKIADVEKSIEGSGPFFYIPQDRINQCASEIRNGDIICFRSSVEGLDISHVALAYWDNGELKFIHASFKEKKVVIDRQTVADYAKNGIRVVRLD